MKDKPVVIYITLIGGASASLCCLINGTGLLDTLISVFIALIAFMILGLICNSVCKKIKSEVEEKEKEAAEQEETSDNEQSDIDDLFETEGNLDDQNTETSNI